MKSWAFCEFQT